MTTHIPGRHRAPARQPDGSIASSSAGAVAKTSAVLAVSGGLVASLGLQAQAATATVTESVSSADAGTSAQQASAVPAALVSGVAAAPSFGRIGFTAQVAPKPKAKPKPRPVVRVERPVQRVSRATVRAAAPKPAPAPVSIKAGAPGSAEFGAAVMEIAARYEGTPYRYGGTTPSGFDCSGYTAYVFRQVGISLPRTSGAQRAATKRISRSEAVPGDLVFMPGHMGIYAGNGMMWDAPRTGKSVAKRAIWSANATYGRVG